MAIIGQWALMQQIILKKTGQRVMEEEEVFILVKEKLESQITRTDFYGIIAKEQG